jgi:hypothetical protein
LGIGDWAQSPIPNPQILNVINILIHFHNIQLKIKFILVFY